MAACVPAKFDVQPVFHILRSLQHLIPSFIQPKAILQSLESVAVLVYLNCFLVAALSNIALFDKAAPRGSLDIQTQQQSQWEGELETGIRLGMRCFKSKILACNATCNIIKSDRVVANQKQPKYRHYANAIIWSVASSVAEGEVPGSESD